MFFGLNRTTKHASAIIKIAPASYNKVMGSIPLPCKIINLDKVEIFERIRDIKFYKGNLYLFLEDTATIAIIEIN